MLYNIVVIFAIHWHESAMGIHVSPILNPSSTFLLIPLLRVVPLHQLWVFHASNLDWWSISYMVIHMFQCYSLKSSHPCLLPQSPKVCLLYLYLFCFLAHRVLVTIFLNSILYTNKLYWCFSIWLTSLCIIGSSFTHLIRTDSSGFFLIAE